MLKQHEQKLFELATLISLEDTYNFLDELFNTEQKQKLQEHLESIVIPKLLEDKYPNCGTFTLTDPEFKTYKGGLGISTDVLTLEEVIEQFKDSSVNINIETELQNFILTGKMLGFKRLHPDLPYFYR